MGRFSKWNDVDIHKQGQVGYICFECKLNSGKDLVIPTVEKAIAHLKKHIAAGHKTWSSTKSDMLLEKEIKDRAVTSVEVHYAVSNNGDGSVSVHFFKNAEEASKYDEDLEEGWGENCSSSEVLHFDKEGILINSHKKDEDE
jgi:hypothetical protein